MLIKKLFYHYHHQLIRQQIMKLNLNWIDTSRVTNMEGLFFKSAFNGDISKWNVGNVIVMNKLFMLSKFNGNIN